MNDVFIILVAIAIATVVALYIFGKGADEINEEKPKINFYELDKFQPRKMTDLSVPSSINLAKKDVTPVSTEAAIAPKKKYYKKKKKKPAIANNAQVDKKPVGRPRKTTE